MDVVRRRSSAGAQGGFAQRVPPHNLEAEMSVLGAMLLSAEAVEIGLHDLDPEDFSRAAHATIFDSVLHISNRGEPVDAITVADRLETTGELERIGGKPYLLDITNTVPTAANVKYYAEIVKRTATLRRLIKAGTHVAALGYDAPDDLDVVVEQAEKAVFDVTQARIESNFTELRTLVKGSLADLKRLAESKEHLTGVPTGFTDLDKILWGLQPSDLVILAARPSVGKTALALNMAVNAARLGHPVALFSLEMSASQLAMRMLCSEARVNSYKLRTGHLAPEDWMGMMKAVSTLGKFDIHVDDTPSASIVEIRAKARRLLRDKPTGLIIVDYLQLMQGQGRRAENRQVEISEMSRGLKMLAKDLHVPVLALSQLSRAVEQRTDKRPMLSDLRESGAIEQDADVVMFIHRDAQDPDQRGEAEIIVAKHRNGPTDSCRLSFIDTFTKFANMPRGQ
jgi:replicative DNA helicase